MFAHEGLTETEMAFQSSTTRKPDKMHETKVFRQWPPGSEKTVISEIKYSG